MLGEDSIDNKVNMKQLKKKKNKFPPSDHQSVKQCRYLRVRGGLNQQCNRLVLHIYVI